MLFDAHAKTSPRRPTSPNRPTRTPMAPSTSSKRAALETSSPLNEPTRIATSRVPSDVSLALPQKRVARADEPNLYDIPSDLHVTYRPISWILRRLIDAASLAYVCRRSLAKISALSFYHYPPFFISSLLPQVRTYIAQLSRKSIQNAFALGLRYALVSTITKLAIQETFFPPSRVATQYLVDTAGLPSTLSNYKTVTPLSVCSALTNDISVSPSHQNVPIGVHFLQYSNNRPVSEKTTSLDAIYLHHGFGASSLSWLPVLPSLVTQLGARVGVAHDAPGFGFTDRPDPDIAGGLEQYGFENNVGIGMSLLTQSLEATTTTVNVTESSDATVDTADQKSVAIFGHSMGAKSALLMTLACASLQDRQIRPQLVVLVAPALEGLVVSPIKRQSKKVSIKYVSQDRSTLGKLTQSLWSLGRKIVLDLPFQYALRRIVSGYNSFWRKGLSFAWGDSSRLTDSDVLRFQWPSIGSGWERGLLSFTRARLASFAHSSSDDTRLLKEVVNVFPNATVVIMYGSNDKVVPFDASVIDKIKKEYPTIKIVKMDGLGHDPFEEDVDRFLTELRQELN